MNWLTSLTAISASAAMLAVFQPGGEDRPDAGSPPPQGANGEHPPHHRGDGPPHGPPPHPLLETFDTDQDGELSKEEIDAASSVLNKLDENEDGNLTHEELPRPPHPPGPPMQGGQRGDHRGGPGGQYGPPPGGPGGHGGPGGPGGQHGHRPQHDGFGPPPQGNGGPGGHQPPPPPGQGRGYENGPPRGHGQGRGRDQGRGFDQGRGHQQGPPPGRQHDGPPQRGHRPPGGPGDQPPPPPRGDRPRGDRPQGDRPAEEAAPKDAEKGSVQIRGGYETDPRDGGRPVALIAAALNVESEVFRDAFSGVTPAQGRGPTGAEARANKEVLMTALGPHGISNDRLDEVSNYYRYRPQTGELWSHRPAKLSAVIENGNVQEIVVKDAGSGYLVAPEVSIAGYPNIVCEAKISYDTDFSQNGRIVSVQIKN